MKTPIWKKKETYKPLGSCDKILLGGHGEDLCGGNGGGGCILWAAPPPQFLTPDPALG